MNISNDRIEKKAKKLLASSRLDADIFAQLLFLKRKQLKHRGIVTIKPNSREWLMVKEITELALQFCNEFNLDRKTGFTKFIELGLSKMNKYSLPKFLNMFGGICNTYEAIHELSNDDNKNLTLQIHDHYVSKIASKTGMITNHKDNPEKYVYFLRVRNEAKKLNLNPKIYIDAQFAGFEWRDGVPDPIQMVGDKALERLNKYLYENNIKVKTHNKNTTMDWKKFKKLSDGNNTNSIK